MEDIIKRAAEKSKMLLVRELLLDEVISKEQVNTLLSKYVVSLHLPTYRIDPKKYLYFLDIKSNERKEAEKDALKTEILKLKNKIKMLEQEIEEN